MTDPLHKLSNTLANVALEVFDSKLMFGDSINMCRIISIYGRCRWSKEQICSTLYCKVYH